MPPPWPLEYSSALPRQARSTRFFALPPEAWCSDQLRPLHGGMTLSLGYEAVGAYEDSSRCSYAVLRAKEITGNVVQSNFGQPSLRFEASSSRGPPLTLGTREENETMTEKICNGDVVRMAWDIDYDVACNRAKG